MTYFSRKEVFIFKNSLSNSTLITDKKKIADYLISKGRNHDFVEKLFIEISEIDGVTEPLYCFQDFGKKNYLYCHDMCFEKKGWSLVKLIGHVAKEKPENENSRPMYQVGEIPVQYFSSDCDDLPQNPKLIGFFYCENREETDFLSYSTVGNESKEEVEEVEGEDMMLKQIPEREKE